MDDRYFYGVRIAAAQALADCSNEANNFIGLEYLLKAFGSCIVLTTALFQNQMILVILGALCCKVHSSNFVWRQR